MVGVFRYIFLLLFLIVVIFTGFFRLDAYLARIISIFELPAPLRLQALNNMRDDGEGKRGLLARATNGGLWFWRGMSLNYAKIDDTTVFSYWMACNSPSVEGNSRKINRDITTDYNVWKNRTTAGKVIVINYVADLDRGVVREVAGYDWKTYMPLPATMEMKCKN